MKSPKIATLFTVMFILALSVFVYAQDPGEVDPMGFVNILLSPAMVIMVGAIVGFTKIVRNTINLKGPLAVVATIVVSLGYGIIQYNSEGFGVAIFVGIVAALVSIFGFKLTKLFGKKVNPDGIK